MRIKGPECLKGSGDDAFLPRVQHNSQRTASMIIGPAGDDASRSAQLLPVVLNIKNQGTIDEIEMICPRRIHDLFTADGMVMMLLIKIDNAC